MTDLEARLDGLYAGSLEDFVASRDALVKELKAAGDKEGAARVKALKRPSVPAWAVNRLRFEAPDLCASLVAAGDRLRSGAPGDLRDAMQARKDVLALARRKVEELLVASGHAAPNQVLQRVAATLESLAFHGGAPGRPVAGRLAEDLDAPSFEEMAALALPAAAVVAAPPPRPAAVAPAAQATSGPAAAEPSETKVAPPAPAVDPALLDRAREAARQAAEVLAARRRAVLDARSVLASAEDAARAIRREREELELRLAELTREQARRLSETESAREALREAEARSRDAERVADEAASQAARLSES